MLKLFKFQFVFAALIALSSILVVPVNFARAGECSELKVLRNNVDVSQTGKVTIPKNSTAKYLLDVTVRSAGCTDSYFRIFLRYIDKNDVLSPESYILKGQVITTNGYKAQLPILTSLAEGTYVYYVQTYKSIVGSDKNQPQDTINGDSVRVVMGSAGTGSTGNNTGTPPATPPATDAKTNTGAGVADIDTKVSLKGVPNFDEPIGNGLFNPIEFETLPQIVVRAIQILFAVVAGLAVIVIIIAGFRMVAFGSNESEVKKAKEALTWAIIGLVVSLLSFSIVAIIQRVI